MGLSLNLVPRPSLNEVDFPYDLNESLSMKADQKIRKRGRLHHQLRRVFSLLITLFAFKRGGSFADFHISEKSQPIGDFTVSRPS